MYGAMREHAPSSTRLAGAITASAVTAAMAGVLAMGMGNYITKAPLAPIMFTALPDAPPPEPIPENERQLDVTSDTAPPLPAPMRENTTFVAEDPPITGSTDPQPRTPVAIPATPAPPTHAPVRVAAKMLPAASPPYPVADVRRGNEGVSSLKVCLDAGGRVTSATIAGSSGHKSLDDAALKWVRGTRFSPAKVDGAPQSVCGHPVDYEWKLDRR